MHRYALVVIDMQRGFLDASSPLFIPGAADTVPACARAIDCCHRAGVPVVFAVRHYRADGSDVERARQCFRRYGLCRAALCRRLREGKALAQVFRVA